MTDEERNNRNPAPEVHTYKPEDCPDLHVSDLEIHRVYILQGDRHAASWNYMGKTHALDPVTLDTIVTHHFNGPRVNLDVFLAAKPDGTLHSADGRKVTIRRFPGPDA